MEILSVLLEILAFFAVTIDLYGEARLNKFHAWLSWKLPDAESALELAKVRGEISRLKADRKSKELWKRFFWFVVCSTLWVLVAIFGNDVGAVLSVSFFTLIILIPIFWMRLKVVALRIFMYLLNVLQYPIKFGEWLLEKQPASGVLLGVGAFLFVLSKTILIVILWKK